MKKRILCIDDSFTALMLLEYALHEAGYECSIAKSVEEAFRFIKDEVPDLILLDLSMPDVSGYDFLRMCREKNLDQIKVIVISAYDSAESIEMTRKLGAVDFISKPIQIETVLKKIKDNLH